MFTVHQESQGLMKANKLWDIIDEIRSGFELQYHKFQTRQIQ